MTPFIGEIRIFGGNFAPVGWAMCDGRILSIAEYSALYNLIGTTYGGDGQQTFGLPDLRGRFPVHQGQGAGQTIVLGQLGGSETVTLNSNQLAVHNHPIAASSAANSPSPANSVSAAWTDAQYSKVDPATDRLAPGSVTPAGGSAPHENRSPYLGLSFIIALAGIYPSRG
ncbi:MAG TPA: tail fiber protein [Streptosporangiaceae bacterium]